MNFCESVPIAKSGVSNLHSVDEPLQTTDTRGLSDLRSSRLISCISMKSHSNQGHLRSAENRRREILAPRATPWPPQRRVLAYWRQPLCQCHLLLHWPPTAGGFAHEKRPRPL